MTATPFSPPPDHEASGSVVDLFCGAGGLSHGFIKEGFEVRAGVDLDPGCRYAFETNNGSDFLEQDIGSLTGSALSAVFANGEPKILVGCAPCRPFSMNNQRLRDDHPEWRLLHSFGSLVRETTPDIVSMENVPSLRSFNGGNLFSEFRRLLEELGYSVWCSSVNCAAYAVPQIRRRLVLLASRVGPIRLIPPTHEPADFLTVRDTIAHLPTLAAGEQDTADRLHRASRLSPTNLARIRASRAGGSWKAWDRSLVSRCHRQASGHLYEAIYGRMSWDAPAPTMTTKCTGFGNGRFGHPEQDRAVSLREAALLQSFPDGYEFFPPDEPTRITAGARMIGNAVPVALAQAIAASVAEALSGASDA